MMALFSTETGDRIFWTHVRRYVFSGSTHGSRPLPPPLPSSLPPSLPSPRESRLFAWEINVRLPRIRGRYHQRNGVTFDKIGYYYPFLLSPQGVARPALARCFVSSSFNCSSRDRQVFELGRGRGKKREPLRRSSPFLPLNKIFEIGREREKKLGSIRVFSSTLKKKKKKEKSVTMERDFSPARKRIFSRRTKAVSRCPRGSVVTCKKKKRKGKRKKGKKEEVGARTWKEVGGRWVVERGKVGGRKKHRKRVPWGWGWCEKVLEPDSQTEETDRQTCGKE